MNPLDTLKVYKQSNIKKTIRIKNLYKGLSYPLLFDTFAGSLLFGTYYNLRKNNFSKEESSLITGIIVGTVMTPFDVYKIKNKRSVISIYLGVKIEPFSLLFLVVQHRIHSLNQRVGAIHLSYRFEYLDYVRRLTYTITI